MILFNFGQMVGIYFKSNQIITVKILQLLSKRSWLELLGRNSMIYQNLSLNKRDLLDFKQINGRFWVHFYRIAKVLSISTFSKHGQS